MRSPPPYPRERTSGVLARGLIERASNTVPALVLRHRLVNRRGGSGTKGCFSLHGVVPVTGRLELARGDDAMLLGLSSRWRSCGSGYVISS